ncbi:FMN-binding protein [Clostridium sp. C2-6-12]|uniref:FMN-binding protein n=1 Tax=Clostridium sp. C2-6-12 TaxID=2698832 RepID=UPI00136B00F8|nr:FMN-binding protein [Clostridium sp. C2-6-12]
MAKKINKSQILRHIIQIILFFTLPGLYAMTFSELKTVYQMIIQGNFKFLEAIPSLIEFITVMLLTAVMGRWFCGWLCAFGAYNDLVYFISKKVFKTRFRVNEKVDSILKYAKYVVLVFIAIISWTMGSSILESTSPWDAFGQITDISTIFSSLLIGLTLLVLITIGAAFIERFFCRYLCPLGAVFSIISKIGIVKINKPKADCGKCRACTMNCSMGLNLYNVDGVRGGDCINCLKCTEVCPRNNANVNIFGQDVDQNLAGSVAMAAMLGVYGLTNFGADALTSSGVVSNQTEISISDVIENPASNITSQYKDGTYTGRGIGFKGRTTKVSVTIADGKITKIETLSYGDDRPYFEKAESGVTQNIISKQSTSVDTVSGATYSSKGIISAVKDALSQATASSNDTANVSKEKEENASSATSTENSKNPAAADTKKAADSAKTSEGNTSAASTSNNTAKSEAAASNNQTTSSSNTQAATPKASQGTTSSNTTSSNQGAYKDGTYTGSGKGFKGGTTTVSVTVSNGKIASVQTVSNGDTPQYYNRASGTVIKNIISKQSTSVDTVSGATYSSKGIMSAVANALSQAK